MVRGRSDNLLTKATLAVAGLILSAVLAACSSADTEPLVIKTLGRIEGKRYPDREEAQRLADAKGAWRRGDVLTVDTEEGIQYRFVDAGSCEGSDTCRVWTFLGSTHVEDVAQSPDGHPVDYWLIRSHDGESGYVLAIDQRNGSSLVLSNEPTASPDKRVWAVGECNFLDGFSLSIFETSDWARMVLRAEAGDDVDCCEVLGWDGAALKVKTCDLEPGKAYEDRLVRQADGRWAGKRIRLEKPKAR